MAMRTGVTTSVIAHASLLIVALAGLSAAKPVTPEAVDSISVDLVPISEITNVRSGSLTSKVVKADAPAIVDTPKPAELAKPTGNTDHDQIKPEETDKVTPAPTVNTAPEPKPAPDPTPAPDPPKDATPPTPEPVTAPVVAPTPAPPEPQQEVATKVADTPADAVAPMPAARPPQLAATVKAPPKDTKPVDMPKPTPTPAKPAPTKTQPSDRAAKLADQVAELINSEKSRGAVTGDSGQATLGKNTGKASVLSQSVLDMLSAAMLKCFNPPIAASFPQPLTLTIISSPALMGLVRASGSDFDPGSGHVLVTALDCDGTPASGVAYDMRQGAGQVLKMYMESGVLTRARSETDATGMGGFSFVPPGFVDVAAYNSSGVRVGSVGVVAAPFTLTSTVLVPAGTPAGD